MLWSWKVSFSSLVALAILKKDLSTDFFRLFLSISWSLCIHSTSYCCRKVWLPANWNRAIYATLRFSSTADASSILVEWTKWSHLLRLLPAVELLHPTLRSQSKPCPGISPTSEKQSSLRFMLQETPNMKIFQDCTITPQSSSLPMKAWGRREKLFRSWASSKISKCGDL